LHWLSYIHEKRWDFIEDYKPSSPELLGLPPEEKRWPTKVLGEAHEPTALPIGAKANSGVECGTAISYQRILGEK
jgi:hypothetical protein